jgi:3-hydroxyisobutyrate dehydrogenase-like beta-hydroxyacid dehydrogenase
MDNLIAFIGFGEAAFHIANGLRSEGLTSIVAYDVNQNDDKKGPYIKKRALEAGITIVDTSEEAYLSAKFIVSLTSASVAYEIAEKIIPNLSPGQVFVDMNSASPKVKSEIGDIYHSEGVLICDAAVMKTVPGNGHKVPMLLSGDGAKEFYDNMIEYGMNLTDLNAQLGGSSAIKMFRSVFMKGLPQLLIESMMAAEKYGVLDILVDSLNDSIKGKTVEKLADTLIVRTLIHAERRASEMKDVISTLEGMGMDASMSIGTKEKLLKIADMDIADKIGSDSNIDYKEAIRLLIAECSTAV